MSSFALHVLVNYLMCLIHMWNVSCMKPAFMSHPSFKSHTTNRNVVCEHGKVKKKEEWISIYSDGTLIPDRHTLHVQNFFLENDICFLIFDKLFLEQYSTHLAPLCNSWWCFFYISFFPCLYMPPPCLTTANSLDSSYRGGYKFS